MLWIKPNGAKIELNEYPDTIAAAEKLGWKRHEEKPKIEAEAPRRGRPKKGE